MSKIKITDLVLELVASQREFDDVPGDLIPQLLKEFEKHEKTARAYKAHIQAKVEGGEEVAGYFLKPGSRTATFQDIPGIAERLAEDFPDITPEQFQGAMSIGKTGLDRLVKDLMPIGTPKAQCDAYVTQLVKEFGEYKTNKPSLKPIPPKA